MNLFNRLLEGIRKKNDGMKGKIEQESHSPLFRHRHFNAHDRLERETYFRSCLEQIADAEKELHQLEYEYTLVTSHMADIEELERLPAQRQKEIKDVAERLHNMESRQAQYMKRKNRMTEAEFFEMEQMEDDAEEGIRKLRETEEYQRLVKKDLKRLNNERNAYEYQLDELEGNLRNYTGIAMICAVTMAVCILILFILQILLEFHIRLGYVLVVCAAALIMLWLFLKHGEAQKEITQTERSLNKLILLQNKVKIRYVNNKNLLDYLCLKFDVTKSGELEALWNKYQEEKKEREQLERVSRDYTYYQKELLRLLRISGIRDTSVWLHQVVAIVDEKEMVELRHNLMNRRKVLREQMDYNRDVAKEAQAEVTQISEKYPQYKDEILGLITEYEKKTEKEMKRREP